MIPKKFHHLISLVKEWGIGDDVIRDQKVYDSTTSTLENLISYFTDEIDDEINKWLCEPKQIEKPTNEYLQFSAFYMACLYAEEVLKNRKMEK